MNVQKKARQAGDDLADNAQQLGKNLSMGSGVVNRLHRAGFKSEYAYVAGFASIALSLGSWLASRGKTGDSKSQSDRWGIFIGHWAPTFMALGVALHLEEND